MCIIRTGEMVCLSQNGCDVVRLLPCITPSSCGDGHQEFRRTSMDGKINLLLLLSPQAISHTRDYK